MSDATRVAIIGLGAIGGSAALKLLERGSKPAGYSVDAEDRRAAAAAGVDVAESVSAAVREKDLVLIAVPLDRLAGVAREVVGAIDPHTTVFHAASLQREDATRMDPDTSARVIGTHPLAGSATSGFVAADPEMFRDATVFVEERGDRRMREDAELFWSMAGAHRIRYSPARDHDDLMGAISHVPQLLATALASTLAYGNVTRSQLGPGGRDMTRLAASSWEMWRPLLAATPGRTLALLESIETELRDIRESIVKQTLDEAAVGWAVARAWALETSREG